MWYLAKVTEPRKNVNDLFKFRFIDLIIWLYITKMSSICQIDKKTI